MSSIIDYKPREQVVPFHARDKRWTVIVAHRRFGKTYAACADLVIGALETPLHRPQFAYLAPQREQAKRVSWTYLKEMTEPMWRKKPNEAELKIEIDNAHGGVSTIYVGGADNPDSMRGLYFDGVVLDEFGDMRPTAWLSVLRPALSDRRGWAVFLGTPRGRNMFWTMREEARLNPDTHLLLEFPASNTGIIDPDELEQARLQMTPETFAIEYECSFDASIPGSYFARDLGAILEKGQIGSTEKFKRDPDYPVSVVGDLGFTDSCAWWVWQKAAGGFRVVDYYEANGREIGHYIDWIRSLGNVEDVWLPHDARAKNLQTGRSIVEVFLSSGINPRLVPRAKFHDGIEAARQVLPICWFDEERCYEGLEHLRAYCRLWDEKSGTFKDRPNHDSHSHCFVSGTMVSVPFGERPIEQIKVGDLVKTPKGFGLVEAAMSRAVTDLVELSFTNGRTVVCTPDHPFITSGGIVRADCLEYQHVLIRDNPCAKSTSFRNLTGFVFTKSQTAISRLIGSRWAAGLFSCIATSGKNITARYHQTTTFITSTVTSLTTGSKTWNAWLRTNIYPCTPKNSSLIPVAWPDWRKPERQPRLGTAQKKAASGTLSTAKTHGKAGPWCVPVHTMRQRLRGNRRNTQKGCRILQRLLQDQAPD